MADQHEERGNDSADQVVSREPATEENERALEREELESFRRRKEWSDRVLGGDGDSDGGSADEPGSEDGA
jgi:hypothetical protein